MSAIEHRKRLAERQAAAGGTGAVSRFSHQENIGTHTATVAPASAPPPERAAVVETPATPVVENEGATVDGQAPDTGIEVATTPQEATGAPAVVPQDPSPADVITPEQMRLQANTTAQALAQLDTDQYQQALTDLEGSNPTLYACVVDELNNMNADSESQEGDGFDLSGISGDQPTQE